MTKEKRNKKGMKIEINNKSMKTRGNIPKGREPFPLISKGESEKN
jgi:hypothetical protein